MLARRQRLGARRRGRRADAHGPRRAPSTAVRSRGRAGCVACCCVRRATGGPGRGDICGILGAVTDVLPNSREEPALPVSGVAVAAGVLAAYGAYAVLISI